MRHQSTPKQVTQTINPVLYLEREREKVFNEFIVNCLCIDLLFVAVCFKNAKQYEQAKDAYLKEAEYHTENKTYPADSI